VSDAIDTVDTDTLSVMSKTRFEAFSDGVFAVAATLLVLDFKEVDLSRVSPSAALAAIEALWRPLLSYVTSFLVVGVIWINHQTLFHTLRTIDRVTVSLNLVLLMLVALIPFPTALAGLNSGSQPVIMLYGLTLAATGVAFNILGFYVRRRYDVAERIGADPTAVRISNIRGAAYPVAYLVAALLSYASTTWSIVLYAILPLVYLLPSPVDYELYRRSRGR
jgi:uncharacterized membrane protein